MVAPVGINPVNVAFVISVKLGVGEIVRAFISILPVLSGRERLFHQIVRKIIVVEEGIGALQLVVRAQLSR
ncbi:MAG: hypothetical protein Udaeo2_26280 [Candidatus Udaeobacter sp.]|nr:MAG: hypothetical protein Udaeo2_26280 [Candidatus Udaeobacter sp.]